MFDSVYCSVFLAIVLALSVMSSFTTASNCYTSQNCPLISGGIFVTSFGNPAEVYFVASIRDQYLKSTLSTIKNLVSSCTPCLGYSYIDVCELNVTMPDAFVNGLELGSDYTCAQSFGSLVPCPWTLQNDDVCLCSKSYPGISVNCSNMGLNSVPLWDNITGFPGQYPIDSSPSPGSIQELFLSRNNITTIGATDFLPFFILAVLDLSFNQIQAIDVNALPFMAEEGEGNLCNNSLPLLSNSNCSNPLCDNEHSVYQALCRYTSFPNLWWECGITDTPYENCCCATGNFEHCRTDSPPETPCCGRPGPCGPLPPT